MSFFIKSLIALVKTKMNTTYILFVQFKKPLLIRLIMVFAMFVIF